MKLVALSLLFVATTAMAGFADNTPMTKVEMVCREQAVLIDQTYRYYKRGDSESAALRGQTDSQTSEATMAWMKNMIHKIYSDSRSMFVDVSTSTAIYEQKCLKNPKAYVRNMRLIE